MNKLKKLLETWYDKIFRTRKTSLTEQELAYCENDVQIIRDEIIGITTIKRREK